jgi:hypothetical protein
MAARAAQAAVAKLLVDEDDAAAQLLMDAVSYVAMASRLKRCKPENIANVREQGQCGRPSDL